MTQISSSETDDNRVWPVAKFQEMLMQLNCYGIKPEESLIEDSKFFMIISHDFGAIHSIISSFMLSLLTTASKDKTHCHKYNRPYSIIIGLFSSSLEKSDK
jgi:hypothetical protein